ncbi:6-phosphogluconate dehydrogenase [Maribacter algarum]|uniref:6-phosphogluconate dehydrogenase n=1 Tax=Maribacter algarum (ex Zhang et al. 2020) TaxID=2578118 RepID=A0A5S3PHE2_9FLAO|nr:6-phosphogluconate dehydrogenase [Maribacter algarum]TMM53685.1 6-phosphogluconate dehydrogenase [Maribacter algarum]
MKKTLISIVLIVGTLFTLVYAFVYFVPYSEGARSGELIKFSNKGVVFNTWEGEISQGVSGAQIFKFSVLQKNQEVIKDLKDYNGQYVKLEYVERYATFFWLGDTKYYITKVTNVPSPHIRN